MQSAIWRICFFECVRGLRGFGLMCSSGTALTGRMRAGEDGFWRLPVCSRPSDRRQCWMGFLFDRMGQLLLNAELARKKIWRDPAMDFYEALHCRPHPSGVPPSLWRYLGRVCITRPLRLSRPGTNNIIGASNISTTTSQKATSLTHSRPALWPHNLVLRGGIPACGDGLLIVGSKTCRSGGDAPVR